MRSTNSKRSRAGDQSPPPQPPNAYALFVREKHAETKARETSRRRGNNVTPQQVITSLSKAWSALSTAEMKPFYAKADRARRRYVKACTIYEQMHETVPAPRRRRRKKAEKKVVCPRYCRPSCVPWGRRTSTLPPHSTDGSHRELCAAV